MNVIMKKRIITIIVILEESGDSFEEQSGDITVSLGCEVVIYNENNVRKRYKYDFFKGVFPKTLEVFTGHKVGDTVEILGDKIKDVEGCKTVWNYKAVKTIGEALEGAQFVVISILPGTFDEMHSDVHTPEKYGIYQSVGDTSGPGGIVRAMRTSCACN